MTLFRIDGDKRKAVNVEDALRFADILSKSTDPKNADKHKVWAQEMVALLKAIEPENPAVEFYLGSVLSSTGNYRGLAMMTPKHQSKTMLDRFYTAFSKDFVSIPAEPENQFFRSQKAVYDRLNEPHFSYSGPTSMGKSFVIIKSKLSAILGAIGNHGKLRWYAVILSQWIKGTGLSFIMEQALQYKRSNRKSGVMVNGKLEDYDDTLPHRNIVISDTLQVIENVILFSISNYFLRFSSEYKRFHQLESFQNDWYEYVEYGTTNPLSIILQRNGFSRETSTYIRKHRNEYVSRPVENSPTLAGRIFPHPRLHGWS